MSSNTEKEILEQIIADEGTCMLDLECCLTCPLAKLKKKSDGTYYSCWESLVPDPIATTGIQAAPLYKKAAEEILSQIAVEKVFLGEDDENRDS